MNIPPIYKYNWVFENPFCEMSCTRNGFPWNIKTFLSRKLQFYAKQDGILPTLIPLKQARALHKIFNFSWSLIKGNSTLEQE